MKKFLPIIVAILAFSASHFGQTVTPQPTPPVNDGDVVKISTNIIQLDVTVTDKKGNPIRDLRPDEIEIYENGKKQRISSISFVPGTRVTAKSSGVNGGSKATSPPVNLPTTPVKPEQVRRTIALVVDDLTLSFSSTFWVREALKNFVEQQMQDGDLVAIIRTGAGVGALQQFTTDKRQLLAAIQRVKFNMSGAGSNGVFNPLQQSLKEQLNGTTDSQGNVRNYGKDIAIEQANEKETNEYRENIFANGTLGALNFIVRGMRDLPGRKSVMLLSDGLRLMDRSSRGTPQATRIYALLQRLVDMANRASVVFHTMDARGLVPYGVGAEDEVTDIFDPITDTKLSDRVAELADTQDGLKFLAKETGGLSVVNQNSISKGIQRVLDDQSYYLVAYEPDDDTFDAKVRRFNKIDVKVTRADVRTRYRSGFFAVADENLSRPKMDLKASLLNALTSPFAVNDVAVRMNAIFAADPKMGSTVKAFVNIDSKDVSFVKQPDGSYKAEFDLVGITFGDNGTILDERSKSFSVQVNQAGYERLQSKGLASSFTVPVKKPGAYQVRLAFRDKTSEKVGSANQFIEVPNLGKKKLSVSGAVLISMPFDKFKVLDKMPQEERASFLDPVFDTSVRQIKSGNVLRFDYEVYNAKRDTTGKTNLNYKLKLYRDNQIVFQGAQRPLPSTAEATSSIFSTSGTIQLATRFSPGDYVLQVEITDMVSREKAHSVNQFVQFQIVE